MANSLFLNLPKRILTPHLILRAPRGGDGEGLLKAMQDGYEDLVKWLNWPETLPTFVAVEEECLKHEACFILRGDIRFLIIKKDTQEIMGRCAYPPLQSNWDIPAFGISYFLAKRFRGQGYAQEATNALTRYAFEVLKARKVEIKVDTENVSSLKIPQELNFTLEAIQKGCWPRKDKEELAEQLTYALFNDSPLPPLETRW